MRTMTDAAGVEWTVFEVRRQSRLSDTWAYLPEGFGEGWLCFESVRGKRRLTPVPADWHELSHDHLATLLERAQPVYRMAAGTEDGANGREDQPATD